MTTNVPQVKEEVCFDKALQDIQQMQNLCKQLMQTKHYQALGEAGIFAVLQKAKSLHMNPLDALGGGIYFVNGKTELSSNSMNYLIRLAGHSIVKDSKSDKACCILHGKRKDNGDTWTASFSIDDAKKAGIYKNTWEKYAEDMLFARALSRLARQLFPDVLKGAYTEGEVRDGVIDNPRSTTPMKVGDAVEVISKEKASDLMNLLKQCDNDYIDKLYTFLNKPEYGVETLSDLPVSMYERVKAGIMKNIEENTVKIEMTTEEKEEAVDE